MVYPCRASGVLLLLVTLAGAPACRAPREEPAPEIVAEPSPPPAEPRVSPEVPPAPRELPEPSAELLAALAPEPVPEPATEPYDVGGEVTRPERISGEPVDLRASDCPSLKPGGQMRRNPVVILAIVIDREGRVTEVDFLKYPPDPCILDYLKTAVSKWRFKPATRRGQPVAVRYNLLARTHFR